MRLEVFSTRIIWIRDPEAYDYQVPCKGCPDFCDDYGGDEDLVEAYGSGQCAGVTLVRQTTRWAVTAGAEGQSGPLHIGFGQSPEEALLDAEAAYVKTQLVSIRLPGDED